METSKDFRKFAEECEQLAQLAPNDHERNILKRMAEAWRRVAKEKDHERV
jgi:hypothetical protein